MDFKHQRPPHFKVVKFLKDLIDQWNPSEVSSIEFRDQIKEAIIDRKIAVNTASVYLTAVKRACMTLDKAVDSEFIEDLKTSIEESNEYKEAEKEQLLEEFKQFSELQIYNQYKMWTAARLSVVPSPFQSFLKDLEFFIDPLWVDWSVKTVLGDEYQQTLEKVRGKALQQQLSDIIFIEDPMLLQNTLLSGLFSQKKSLLLPALLFACGRRSSAVILNKDDFKPAEEFARQGNAVNSYAFDFVERLKQGLRVIPTEAPSLPLLCPYGLFKRALDRFHSKLVRPYEDVTDVNKNLSHHFSEWTKKRTGGIIKQARQLRVLYAKFVSVLFGKREHQNLFIQKALVHASVTTSLNYTRINFPSGDNAVSLYIPPWVENGEPHPLPELFSNNQLECKKNKSTEEKKEVKEEKKLLHPVIQEHKHGAIAGGGVPYDAKRLGISNR